MVRSRNAVLTLMGLAAFTAGCGRNTPPPAPAPVDNTPSAPPSNPQPTQPAPDPNAAQRAAMANLEELVYFDYDESMLRSDARTTLDRKVSAMREFPAFRLMIEGHADERGSTEYNLALGNRRAVAIRDYLVGFGLETGRFQTTSYGEERPRAQGASESAWAQNRRGEFRVSGGSGSDR